MADTRTDDQSVHYTFCALKPFDTAQRDDDEDDKFPKVRSGILTRADVADDMGRVLTRAAVDDIAATTETAYALFQHNMESLIGTWDSFTVDAEGQLRAECTFDGITQRSRETYAQVAAGAITGVSVGYRRLEWAFVEDNDEVLIQIDKAELIEASICLMPRHADAMIASQRGGEYELERAAYASSGKRGSLVVERLSNKQLRSLRTFIR